MTEEECQEKRADVRAIDIGIRHDDDPVVAQVGRIELLADRGPKRRDERPDLCILEHLIQPRLLDIQDLPAQRQNRLVAAVAPLLGRPTGRVTLDDEQFGTTRVALGTVGQLARQ